jgi:hypothetical protein
MPGEARGRQGEGNTMPDVFDDELTDADLILGPVSGEVDA